MQPLSVCNRIEDDNLPFPVNSEFDAIGFNSGSPFFPPNLLPPSPFVGSKSPFRKDSLDLMALPSPVLNSTTKPETMPDGSISMSGAPSFFDTSSAGQSDIFSSLPSLEPIHPMKREPEYSVTSGQADEEYEDEASAKRQRRLAKNREIAKNCRRRKKERKAAIQEEVVALQACTVDSAAAGGEREAAPAAGEHEQPGVPEQAERRGARGVPAAAEAGDRVARRGEHPAGDPGVLPAVERVRAGAQRGVPAVPGAAEDAAAADAGGGAGDMRCR